MVRFETKKMGSQGGSDPHPKFQSSSSLSRQGSLYSLTLDEVQNQLGDLGKPLSSMNLDELLKNVWTAEATMGIEGENNNTTPAADAVTAAGLNDHSGLQRQPSMTVTGPWSKKTVDEVWRDIQQGNGKDEEKKSQERRERTLGEMTLEDFLVKAGVVTDGAGSDKRNVGGQGMGVGIGVDLMQTPSGNFQEQAQWLNYQVQQPAQPPPAQSNMMGVYIPCRSVVQPLPVATPLIDGLYSENQMSISSPLMGALSDTQTHGRKRGASGDMIEKTVERRQKRMIKNRESAARSRARKQAYTNELENKVSRLEEENKRLKTEKVVDDILPYVPPPEPKYQLRRTSSAGF